MNEFDPKNDLIDKYLKGELSGAALHGFEESLEQDEELRKSLEQRRLVYEVIVQYGRVEMKNFLRKQTTHRRIFSISRKNFYYAAAAIALILLGTTVVMLKLTEQATRNKENVATGLKTDKQDQCTTNFHEQGVTQHVSQNPREIDVPLGTKRLAEQPFLTQLQSTTKLKHHKVGDRQDAEPPDLAKQANLCCRTR